jgi:hypothetical protein
MNAKHESSTNRPAVADDVFVSTLIPARHWIASAAALLMTTLTLAIVSQPVHTPELAWVNGIHVTNLAPVEVTPTSADLKAAAVLGQAAVGSVILPDGGSAAQLGAQLAMPYYSFGTATASIASSKE